MTREYVFLIDSITTLTNNIALIIAKPEKKTSFSYIAGQYVQILYPNGSYQPFSIANAPLENGLLEFHIRHLHDDVATTEFLTQLKTQKKIQIKGPFGKCYYHESAALAEPFAMGVVRGRNAILPLTASANSLHAPHLKPESYSCCSSAGVADHDHLFKPCLLLATGTGFAQSKAIIEQATRLHDTPSMHLYWGVKKISDLYLPHLPEQWQQTLPNFKYTPVISQPEPHSAWQGKTGYVHSAVIADYPNLADYQVYASGAAKMVFAALELMQQHSLDKNNFYSDML